MKKDIKKSTPKKETAELQKEVKVNVIKKTYPKRGGCTSSGSDW